MSELSKVLYRCRRGTKELDLLTSNYAKHHFSNATDEEQQQFIRLLEMQDPALYYLLVDQQSFDDPVVQSIVEKVRAQSL